MYSCLFGVFAGVFIPCGSGVGLSQVCKRFIQTHPNRSRFDCAWCRMCWRFAVHRTFHGCTVNISMLTGVQHSATETLCPNCPNRFPPGLRRLPSLQEEKSTSRWPPQREGDKNGSTRPRTQSVGPVPLLLHKGRVLLHKKAGGDKDRGHVEKGAIPLICALGAFQGKDVGPACFIANASVTSKGP